MLELRNIVKDYVSGNNVTHALKGISVNFRKNEFVSILGASGCGKTTTLNIIGGLDRYTSGDLLINEISTKNYNDRDWDTYRNHSIGFIFQTYNLIAHQNILKNVELALTISGVSKEERKRRSLEVLKKVGLEGMEKKKPNQLSGGQCQRVAIARALVNNPEILLADEPTGALDSETSVQIMELLKEVASDRLVIMVTHNPDLAYKYSTRIIKMSDGNLIDDSNPFDKYSEFEKKPTMPTLEDYSSSVSINPVTEIGYNDGAIEPKAVVKIGDKVLEEYKDYLIFTQDNKIGKATAIVEFINEYANTTQFEYEFNIFKGKSKNKNKTIKNSDTSKGRKKKTSMSLFTSVGLSTSNLFSKLKRTILVTIAGSIGIIGVSSVLAVSRGVKDYIKNLQKDMLSSYPITIAEEAVDYTSLMTGLDNKELKDKFEFDPKNPKIGVDSMINYLMSTYSDITNVKTNVIDEDLLAFIDSAPKDDIAVIKNDYGIDPTNNIFGKWKATEGEEEKYWSFNGLTQRYISELKTVEGFGAYASYVDLFTSFMNELPDNDEYILDQYDVIASKEEGKFSSGEGDLVLVVDGETTLTDLVLAQTGVFDHDSFINIAECAIKEQDVKKAEGFEQKTQEEKDAAIKAVRDLYPYEREFEYSDLLDRDFYYLPQDSIYSEDNHVADDEYKINVDFTILDSSSNLDTIVTLSLQNYLGFDLLYGTMIHNNSGTFENKTICCVSVNALTEKTSIASKEDLNGMWVAFEPTALMGVDMNDPASLLSSILFGFKLDFTSGDKVYYHVPTSAADINFMSWIYGAPAYGAEEPRDVNVTCIADPVKGYSYEAILSQDKIDNISSEEVKGIPMKITSILRLKDSKSFGCLQRGLYYTKAFGDKYKADSKDAKVSNALKDFMNSASGSTSEFSQAYVKFPYYDHGEKTIKNDGYARTLNGDLASSFGNLFSSITGVDYAATNQVFLRSLCGQKAVNVLDENGDPTGVYEFKDLPKEISIYPKTFEGKDRITDYLDVWKSDETIVVNNKELKKTDRPELTYSDTISLIAAVIDTFINAITVALVVFTSLSLVVSCFMIAVITYISIVERIKEIGVIRSLGGRKRDVANLFVAETFMTGLFSGVFGIIITYILQFVLNAVLVAKFALSIVHLTLGTAAIMIGVSVLLSVLSGLIPSQSAAHKDPVVALRSNE